eukprot:scaffold26519_cov101-Isochrysis_galbana.AAC.2
MAESHPVRCMHARDVAARTPQQVAENERRGARRDCRCGSQCLLRANDAHGPIGVRRRLTATGGGGSSMNGLSSATTQSSPPAPPWR